MSDASSNDPKTVDERSLDSKDESKGEDEELDALLDGKSTSFLVIFFLFYPLQRYLLQENLRFYLLNRCPGRIRQTTASSKVKR